jgi:uncharacterized protein (DUF427 family)
VVVFADEVVAETRHGVEVLETSHPPTYYFPPEDVRTEALVRVSRVTVCEWKGQAVTYDVVVGDRRAAAAAWSYPQPTERGRLLAGHVAFYAGPMDACTVDGERVRPQEGGFYGGWITPDLAGPFKGGPGSWGW